MYGLLYYGTNYYTLDSNGQYAVHRPPIPLEPHHWQPRRLCVNGSAVRGTGECPLPRPDSLN